MKAHLGEKRSWPASARAVVLIFIMLSLIASYVTYRVSVGPISTQEAMKTREAKGILKELELELRTQANRGKSQWTIEEVNNTVSSLGLKDPFRFNSPMAIQEDGQFWLVFRGDPSGTPYDPTNGALSPGWIQFDFVPGQAPMADGD
ncbi:hypothetical protein KQI84_08590 [bacterium]|nr:hypothetical protein [bacterium]